MFDEREASQPHEWTHEDAPHSTNRKTSAATAQRWLTAGPVAANAEMDLSYVIFGTETGIGAQEPIVRSAAERRGWQPLPLSKAQLEELWERDDPVPTRNADLYGKERRQLVLQFDKYEWEFEPDADKEGGGGWEEEARPAKPARESIRQERPQTAAQTTRSPPAFDSGMFSLHATAPSELYLQQLGPTPLELQLRHEWEHWEKRRIREMAQTQTQTQGAVDRKTATASAQRWLTAGPTAADSSQMDRGVSESESAPELPVVRSGLKWQPPTLSKAQLEELWERDEPVPTRNADLYGKERRQLVLQFDKYEWEFEHDADKEGGGGWSVSDFYERPGVAGSGEPSSRDHRAMLIQQRKH